MSEKIPQLRKRGKKFYVFWTERGKTQRLSLGTEDPAEAKARYAAFLTAGPELQGGPADMALTCGDALTHYRIEHVERNVVDVSRQITCIDHLIEHFGNMAVCDVTEADIDSYCASRSSGGIGKASKPSTHRRELTALQAAFKHEKKKKRLKLEDIPEIISPPEGPPRDRWISKSELKTLFQVAKMSSPGVDRLPRVFRFSAIAYYTASRRNALERLTWFQVDLNSALIHLARPGEKKTNKRRPIVPISPALLPIIRQAYEERVSEYVLDHPGDIFSQFSWCVSRAGLKDVTPHTLRHTRAVHLAQDGVSLYDIGSLLGDNIATVERVYLHHCPEHLASIMDADVGGIGVL